MTTKFSVLIQPIEDFEYEEDSTENPYMYCVLRSFDGGLVWHHLFTMVHSDPDDVADIVHALNSFYSTSAPKKSIAKKSKEDD